jgi:hypothetical protein
MIIRVEISFDFWFVYDLLYGNMMYNFFFFVWWQWKKLVVRLDLLSMQLNKPDIWDDPVHAGRISREHGSLMGKMKEVRAFERELLEHIDMIKLAREENDAELESVGTHFFI